MNGSDQPARSVLAGALLYWLVPQQATFASDLQAGLTRYVREVWQSDRGLPQDSVQSIVQTRDGYLWVATQAGLARFDGVRFTVFTTESTPAIQSNRITALLEDQLGNLWVGTTSGLLSLQGGAFVAFTTKQGLSDDSITAIGEDQAGAVWIGTDNGLNRHDHGRFARYTTREGLPSKSVKALLGGHDGSVWIGTENGVCRFRGEHFTTYSTEHGLSSKFVRSLYEDAQGRLWVGTNRDLSRLEGGRFVTYAAHEGLRGDSVLAFHQDRQGNFWVGTNGNGLQQLDQGRFVAHNRRNGFVSDIIECIYEDREGNLWLGTDGNGLVRLSLRRFATHTTDDGLAQDLVWSVSEDKDGDVWVGTNDGLSRIHQGRFETYSTHDGLPSNRILSTYPDRGGTVWTGTSAGLARLEKGRFRPYARTALSEYVLALFEDRAGRLWAGGVDGLVQFVGGTANRAYTSREGLPHVVRAIAEDREGTLWIGTNAGGVYTLKDGRLKNYSTREGLSSGIVLSLYADQEGGVWIGTDGGGLNHVQNGNIRHYTTRNGLFDDAIYTILEDDDANLWMSSSKGIFRASKRQLNDVAAGKASTIASIAYGASDGIKSSTGTSGVQPGSWKARDGTLWFATIGGVVSCNPKRLSPSRQPPPVLVEQLVIDGTVRPIRQKLTVPSGYSKLELHYTGFDFAAPEKIRFKYKLEGFDKDWVDAEGRRTAYYTRLSPGKYVFKVTAANADGVWNEAGASVSFYLKPHFYQTVWFYLACGVAGAAGLREVYGRRLQRLKKREHDLAVMEDALQRRLRAEHELAEHVAEEQRLEAQLRQAQKMEAIGNLSGGIAHDFNNLLTVIEGYSSMLLDRVGDDAELRGCVEQIDHASERAATLTRQLLAFSRRQVLQPKVINLNTLVTNLDRMLERLIGEDIELATVLAPDLSLVRADPSQLEQVIMNLVVNARDAMPKGGTLTIETANVELDDSYAHAHVGVAAGRHVMLAVSDTGVGMDAETRARIFEPFFTTKAKGRGTGLGLSMAYGIVKQSGGSIWVYSEPGHGTTFKIYLPRAEGATDVLSAAQPTVASLRGSETILLVEDNRQVRELAGAILTDRGYSVLVAENGPAAVALSETHSGPIDLLLADVVMPGQSGRAVAGQISNARPAIKVLYMSGYTTNAIVHHGVTDAGTFFLQKPFTPAVLAAKVREVLDSAS